MNREKAQDPKNIKIRNMTEEIVREQNLYPINSDKWNTFVITHISPHSNADKTAKMNEIQNKVGKANGIYVYEKEGSIIYLGKAKPLSKRLFSHYRESFEEVPGDTKTNRWHRFFKEHNGVLTVYWKEINGEKERVLVETILNYLVAPLFNTWN